MQYNGFSRGVIIYARESFLPVNNDSGNYFLLVNNDPVSAYFGGIIIDGYTGASKRSHSIARDSKLVKEIVELMSKTSKMHMHVENLEVAKYKMGKVDGDENKFINWRHQINVRGGILVNK